MNTLILQFSQNRLLLLIIVMFFLASWQNTKSQETQHIDETTHNILMERITELYNSGEYVEFIKLAENESNKSENDLQFYMGLSHAYANLGNWDKAFYYAEKLLDKEPSNYYALFAIGNYYFILEKLDSAEFYYNKVLTINPYYARANLNLAVLYSKQDNKSKAVEQYLKAIELFKENNFMEEVNHYSNEVLKLDPDNRMAKEYLVKNKL